MATHSQNIPEEFRVTTAPMLSLKDASAAVDFYKKAFGAVEIMRMVDDSNGKLDDPFGHRWMIMTRKVR